MATNLNFFSRKRDVMNRLRWDSFIWLCKHSHRELRNEVWNQVTLRIGDITKIEINNHILDKTWVYTGN